MSFRKNIFHGLALASLIFLTQCADDPAGEAASAEVVDDAEAEAAALELANSLDFGLGDEDTEEAEDPALDSRVFVFGENSKIGFVGSKLTAIHEGSFKNFSGHFTVAGDGVDVDGTHRITIDMASVATDDEKLTTHLKSEDFFDVAKFPVTTFSLLKMTAADGEAGAYQVAGILDLHGVKKKITFPAQIDVAEDSNSLKMQARFSIDRKAFGIVYPGLPDDLIRDRVVIDLDLEAQPGDPAPLNLTASEQKSQPIVLSAPDNAGDPRSPTAGGAPGEGGGRRGGGGGRGGTPAETIARMDGNGDGKLTADEVPEFVWSRMSAADTNGDGSIDEEEMTVARAAREAEGGGGGPRGGGGGRPRGDDGDADESDR